MARVITMRRADPNHPQRGSIITKQTKHDVEPAAPVAIVPDGEGDPVDVTPEDLGEAPSPQKRGKVKK